MDPFVLSLKSKTEMLFQVPVAVTRHRWADTTYTAYLPNYEGDTKGKENPTQCPVGSKLCSGGAVANYVYTIINR